MRFCVSSLLSRVICNVHLKLEVVENGSVIGRSFLLKGIKLFCLPSRIIHILRFITEGTAVTIPPYVLFRHPAYFSPAPDAFWPDRWLHENTVKRTPHSAASDTKVKEVGSNPESEVITNTAAFIPFSYGPANCAGRALALVEMRMVVALLVQRFEIQFADNYDPSVWEEHLEDFFVFCNGELRVKLTPRM